MSWELVSNQHSMLGVSFFDQSADDVAYDLIGCGLNWRLSNMSESRIITETESYVGPEDLASVIQALSSVSKNPTNGLSVMLGMTGAPAGRLADRMTSSSPYS